ncbi:hypothetical protein Hanom_Chr15g01345101 [Helianthus anomalus]
MSTSISAWAVMKTTKMSPLFQCKLFPSSIIHQILTQNTSGFGNFPIEFSQNQSNSRNLTVEIQEN